MDAKNKEMSWKADEQRAERKERLDALKGNNGKKKPIRKKISKSAIIAVLVVIAALAGILYLFLLSNGYKERHTVVGTIRGDGESYPITALEANYYAGNLFYNSTGGAAAFNANGRTLLTTPQIYGDNGKTYREAALDGLRQQLINLYAMNKKAEADGTTLSEANAQMVSNYGSVISNAAQQQGLTDKELMESLFGKGMTIDQLKPLLSRGLLIGEWQQKQIKNMDISDADIEKSYNDAKDNYDSVSYRLFKFNASTPDRLQPVDEKDSTETAEASAESASATENAVENGESTSESVEAASESAAETSSAESTSMTPEESSSRAAEEMARAREKADAMLQAVKDEESFKAEALAYTPDEELEKAQAEDPTLVKSAQKSSLSPSLAAWLFDAARKPGDKTVIEGESEYTVLYFIKRIRDDRPTFTTRHILIKQEGTDQTAQKTAEEKAQRILDEYKNGEQTEDAFAALAGRYSEDPGSKDKGGLYEDVAPSSFVPEYENWALDPARKAGDVGLVHVDSTNYSGYHIIYFVKAGDPGWKMTIHAQLAAERFAKEMEDYTKDWTFETDDAAMELVLPYDRTAMESVKESLAAMTTAESTASESSGEVTASEESAGESVDASSEETTAKSAESPEASSEEKSQG